MPSLNHRTSTAPTPRPVVPAGGFRSRDSRVAAAARRCRCQPGKPPQRLLPAGNWHHRGLSHRACSLRRARACRTPAGIPSRGSCGANRPERTAIPALGVFTIFAFLCVRPLVGCVVSRTANRVPAENQGDCAYDQQSNSTAFPIAGME
jgi:hypothetical protein